MKHTISKHSARLAALLVVALAVAAAPAQAVTITPAGTAVTASDTSNAGLTYGGNTFSCSTSGGTGTTASPASDTLRLGMGFSGCSFYYGAPTIATTGTVSFKATSASGSGTGAGSLVLGAGDSIVITDKVFGITVCTVSINGPQTVPNAWHLGFGAPDLTVNAPLAATRTGSSACGPASGTIVWQGGYDLSPNIAIN